MRLLLLFAFVSVVPVTGATCMPVTSDRILGRDLTLTDPRFGALPSSLIVGSAPSPGTRRIFAVPELARIARANGIALPDPVELCFEIPMQNLDKDQVLEEMRRSLPEAELTLVEISKALVPVGSIEFPIAGLEPASVVTLGVRLWHGFVRYSDTRKIQVWARVEIFHTLTAVVATRDLPANALIEASSLRVEKQRTAAFSQIMAIRIDDVAGKLPKRALKAGAMIPVSLLDQAPDIRRGQEVSVEVRSGGARLQLSAIAERDGRSGDLVDLRNPASGRTFRARLNGPKAFVVVGGGL